MRSHVTQEGHRRFGWFAPQRRPGCSPRPCWATRFPIPMRRPTRAERRRKLEWLAALLPRHEFHLREYRATRPGAGSARCWSGWPRSRIGTNWSCGKLHARKPTDKKPSGFGEILRGLSGESDRMEPGPAAPAEGRRSADNGHHPAAVCPAAVVGWCSSVAFERLRF